MRRLLVVAVVLAIGVGVVPPPADATPVSELHACWAMTATARRCYDDVAVAMEFGGRVDLRVRVTPAHAGQQVNLFRMRPPSAQWAHFRTLTLSPQGRAHFVWQTQASDIRERDYRFQFRLPGHPDRSNVVQVAVIHCVEC